MNILFVTLLVASAAAFASAEFPPWDESCQQNLYPVDPSRVVPTYQVNLDLPPQQRWTELVTKYREQVVKLVTYIKGFILDWSPELKYLVSIVDNDLGHVADRLPEPFGEELKGIAFDSGLPLGDIVLYNIFYEIFTVCTSIVGKDANGTTFHARNLDFGLFVGWDVTNKTWILPQLLRPMVANIEYMRNGTLLYKGISFIGYVGMYNGVKPNVLSLTLNERFQVNGGYVGLIEWALRLNTNQTWATLLPRQLFETEGIDYATALDKLSNTPLIAPCYYILGGPGPEEAAVITRDRKSAANVWHLADTNGTWYLAETNYDHWNPPPFFDDRITPANTCIKKNGLENFNFAGLFNVLSSRPVLNKLTVYSTLMELNTGRLETYIQDCPDPCAPF